MAHRTVSDLSQKSRLELTLLAEALHVADSDVMTRAELREAIRRAQSPELEPAPRTRSWLGVARGLVASVLEQGLNLPEAAALVRGDSKLGDLPRAPPPIATVTLARIYAAQGHLQRAVATLGQVLQDEPDHDRARELWLRFSRELAEQASTEATDAPPTPPSGPQEDAPPPIAEATIQKLQRLGESLGAPASGSREPQNLEPVPSATEETMDQEMSHLQEPPPPPERRRLGHTDPGARPEATGAVESAYRSAASQPLPGASSSSSLPWGECSRPPVECEAVLLGPEHPDAPAVLCWAWPDASWPTHLEAKMFGFCPGPGGPHRQERVFSLGPPRGVLCVQGLPRGLVLRAVLGTRSEDGEFTPLLVAASLRLRAGRDVPQVEFLPSADRRAVSLAERGLGSPDTLQTTHW